MAIRKSIALLTVITALFTVACETEEDPGADTGNGIDTTLPAGDTGAEMPTTTVAGG